MSDTLTRYLELERQLLAWRVEHPEDTVEEDALLDEMDVVWDELSEDDIAWLDSCAAKRMADFKLKDSGLDINGTSPS